MTYLADIKALKLSAKFKLNGEKSTTSILLRLFIRAYVHKEWNLVNTLSFDAAATWLTAAGYPTNVDNFKMVGRSKTAYVSFPALPLTKGVSELLTVLVKQFSQLDLTCVLSTEDVARFTKTLN
jgi:hypothetical protein